MDDIVVRGMAKWPDVPAVYGWLRLDRRGRWLIKGERVENPAVNAFIGRNYECADAGRWFFQNGPQRVFVELDYAPFVYRIVNSGGDPLALEAHTGAQASSLRSAWMDEQGTLLVDTDLGPGTIHDRDLERLIPAIIDVNGNPLPESVFVELMELLQSGQNAPMWIAFGEVNVKIAPIRSDAVARKFGFVARPAAPAGAAACS